MGGAFPIPMGFSHDGELFVFGYRHFIVMEKTA
jgi:hypothetical protein